MKIRTGTKRERTTQRLSNERVWFHKQDWMTKKRRNEEVQERELVLNLIFNMFLSCIIFWPNYQLT